MSSSQANQDTLVATTIGFTTVSTLIVTLRLFARGVLIKKLGHDDWTICIASAAVIAYLVEILLARDNKIGFPMDTLSLDNMVNLMKITLAIQITYYIAVIAIKLSILLMYLRFAVDQKFRKIVVWTAGFHVVFLIICIVVVLLQCRPLAKFWDMLGTVDGVCDVDGTAFFYFTSAFNILTDIFILGLPVKTLLHINRPRREKIALLGIFLIGTFATITSIIRLYTIREYTLAEDPFRESINVNLWSVIEVNTGIICASVPALKALFTPKVLREASDRIRKTGYGTNRSRGGSQLRTGVHMSVFNRSHRGQEEIDGSGHVDIVSDSPKDRGNRDPWLDSTPGGIHMRTEFRMSDRREDKDSEASSQDGIIPRP